MNVVLHIPDDLVEQLGAGGDVERLALEALAAEAYRAGRLTKAELQRLLGAETGRSRSGQALDSRRRMSVEQMLAVGSEIAALPILDRRQPSQIMDELNAL